MSSDERPATAEEIRALIEAHLAKGALATSSKQALAREAKRVDERRDQESSSPTRRPRRRRPGRSTFVQSLEARGARGCRPRDFPARSQAGTRSIFENRTGREARRFLSRLPRKQRAHVLHLALHPGNGRVLSKELNHKWSRWVVACAWLLHSLRRRSKRHGMTSVVDGYTQGMFCGLFRDANGEAYSISRLFASSYRVGSDECGPMYALRRAGLWTWAAPPTGEADPRFVGPPHVLADGSTRRFAFAVYWLLAIPD